MLSKSNFFEKFSTVVPGAGLDSNGIYFSSISMDGLEEMHKYSTNEKLYEFFEKKEFKEKMIRMFISRPELLNQLR